MPPKKTDRMRALSVRVRNWKCIKAVEIDLHGDITEIRGDSGEGKTAILEALRAAASVFTHPDAVRKGATEAEIELVLSDAIINRTIPAADTSDDDPEAKRKWGALQVKDRLGKPIEKPEEFLRFLFRPSAFDPLKWVLLAAGDANGRTERLREQRRQLIEALPLTLSRQDVANATKALGDSFFAALRSVNPGQLDYEQHAFTVCNGLERLCSEKRTLLNARKDDAQARLDLAPAPDREAPDATLDQCLAEESETRESYYAAKNASTGRAKQLERRAYLRDQLDKADPLPTLSKVESTRAAYHEQAEAIQEELAELAKRIEASQGRLKEVNNKIAKCDNLRRQIESKAAMEADLHDLEQALGSDDSVDVAALEADWRNAQANVEARRVQDAHDAAVAVVTAAREEAEVFDRMVQLFRDEIPKELLAKANLPLDGLSVDGDKVLYNGLPIHLLGTSEQIKIGVNVAAALNPRSPFFPIDQAESLGRADRAALAQAARELGLQLVMTFVDPDAVPADGVVVMKHGEAFTKGDAA